MLRVNNDTIDLSFITFEFEIHPYWNLLMPWCKGLILKKPSVVTDRSSTDDGVDIRGNPDELMSRRQTDQLNVSSLDVTMSRSHYQNRRQKVDHVADLRLLNTTKLECIVDIYYFRQLLRYRIQVRSRSMNILSYEDLSCWWFQSMFIT